MTDGANVPNAAIWMDDPVVGLPSCFLTDRFVDEFGERSLVVGV